MGEKENNLTTEQQKILASVFGYKEKAAITDEDIAWAKEAFKTPEDFQRLRKLLQHFTLEERGMAYSNPQSLITAEITDIKKYAIETAVNNLADEKIKRGLLGFYNLFKSIIVAEKKKEFEAENIELAKEEKQSEEFQKEQEHQTKRFGSKL